MDVKGVGDTFLYSLELSHHQTQNIACSSHLPASTSMSTCRLFFMPLTLPDNPYNLPF